MRKGSKNNCKSVTHQIFKDRAKNRVDDLQGMFVNLQFARKESRTSDVTVLEEQVHQMLREWKSELNEPSPASSLLLIGAGLRGQSCCWQMWKIKCKENEKDTGGSLGSFSADIGFLLERCEEDDATSALAEPAVALKPDPDAKSLNAGISAVFQEDYFANNALEEHAFQEFKKCKNSALGFEHNTLVNNFELIPQFDYNPTNIHQDFNPGLFNSTNVIDQCLEDSMLNICPPPSAFLGPKCALWDCPRPALGSEWCLDYCSSFHASLALNESPIGMTPVLRPGGIGLKDGPLFSALSAKTQGKDVGIPECEGAATSKSPWNAPELFDLSVLEGETIREWLFFDKPRRAFESGNRKQRSLPDYSGRGWHESRKQVMKEFGGLKRSYYMDPQPLTSFEWHLYEYEINGCDASALYRLELKFVDGKRSPRGGKATNDSVADLQRQMRRLGSEFHVEHKRSIKGRTKVKGDNGNRFSGMNRTTPFDETLEDGLGGPYNYFSGNMTNYYGI